jgi:hypothetical protein
MVQESGLLSRAKRGGVDPSLPYVLGQASGPSSNRTGGFPAYGFPRRSLSAS